MHGWARSIYPADWQDRCSVVTEYLSQLDDDTLAALLKKPWGDIFAVAEKEWPEAFAGWPSAAYDNQ